ncbi:pH response protein [Fonsecaea nubica]|uniref:pH response protein n=1 Tax=Fonsecaea nubica TaxID=856822 RepID=A0A178BTI9_9EURO|nr:pH response protein [Fonsecaea nubica]OAL20356.1 pH response protein [Fonsecaea nubica]
MPLEKRVSIDQPTYPLLVVAHDAHKPLPPAHILDILYTGSVEMYEDGVKEEEEDAGNTKKTSAMGRGVGQITERSGSNSGAYEKGKVLRSARYDHRAEEDASLDVDLVFAVSAVAFTQFMDPESIQNLGRTVRRVPGRDRIHQVVKVNDTRLFRETAIPALWLKILHPHTSGTSPKTVESSIRFPCSKKQDDREYHGYTNLQDHCLPAHNPTVERFTAETSQGHHRHYNMIPIIHDQRLSVVSTSHLSCVIQARRPPSQEKKQANPDSDEDCTGQILHDRHSIRALSTEKLAETGLSWLSQGNTPMPGTPADNKNMVLSGTSAM